jgi:hypothetical protein
MNKLFQKEQLLQKWTKIDALYNNW